VEHATRDIDLSNSRGVIPLAKEQTIGSRTASSNLLRPPKVERHNFQELTYFSTLIYRAGVALAPLGQKVNSEKIEVVDLLVAKVTEIYV